MAVRQEQNPITGNTEIVIDGWQQGISDSPEFGMANSQNINIDSIPGIALCNYALKPCLQTNIAGNVISSDAAADTVTLDTTINYGSPIVFANTIDGVTAGVTYYAGGNPSSPTSTSGIITTLYTQVLPGGTAFTGLVNITGNMSGLNTYKVVIMGKPVAYAVDNLRNGANFNFYIIDSTQKVWVNLIAGTSTNGANSIAAMFTQLYGNPSSGTGNGIAFYDKYLFVFGTTNIDIYDAYGQEGGGTTLNWLSVAWKTNLTSASHPAHVSVVEQVLYYGNTNTLDSISTDGTVPPKIANFIQTQDVLTLPSFELISSIEEPSIDTGSGTLMYVGTSTSQYIYPWDKHSTGTSSPLVMPEIGTYQMLNINKLVYILAGQRGNIYYTNGSSVVHFSKVPYQPTGTPYPIITWGGIMSLRNNLIFGFSDANNNASGVWSIALAVGQLLNSVAGAIRCINQSSAGNYIPSVLIPQPNGLNYFAGWYNVTYGGIDLLDTVTPSFYSYNTTPSVNQGSFIETEIIPIGTAINPKNLSEIQAKLDTPLVNGEKFRICMRSNLSDNYSKVFEVTTAGEIDGTSASTGTPIQNLKWVQLRADLQTVSGGSFVRLKEIRFI